MELSFKSTSLLLTLLLTGLSAGLFYAWEVSVIPGTRQISDKSYLEAMQVINRAILNPAFYLIFFGALLLLLMSSYLQFRVAVDATFCLLVGALICYILGTFVVTVAGNVPLNDALDNLNLASMDRQELADARLTYEQPWNRWHRIRSIFSVLAFLLSLLAAFVQNNSIQS